MLAFKFKIKMAIPVSKEEVKQRDERALPTLGSACRPKEAKRRAARYRNRIRLLSVP